MIERLPGPGEQSDKNQDAISDLSNYSEAEASLYTGVRCRFKMAARRGRTERHVPVR